jgi:hypothetical protein
MLSFRFASALWACLALLSSAAGATSISVTNSSFESPIEGGPNGFTGPGACPTGWSCNGGFAGGVFYPTSTQYAPGSDGLIGSRIVPDGNQEAWVQGQQPQYLEQNVGTIGAGTNYTLSVYAGARNDQQPDAWAQGYQPTIEFLANGVVVAATITTDPGNGNWKQFSVTLAASDIATANLVGDALGIVLLYPGTVFTETQVGWDEVTVDAATVSGTPLPGALPLFASVLGMFGLFARSRKWKNFAA